MNTLKSKLYFLIFLNLSFSAPFNLTDYIKEQDFTKTVPKKNILSENPIPFVDSKSYFIGPGDEFSIALKNMPSVNHLGKVNLYGDLYFPNLGICKLGRIPLDSAQKLIFDFARNKLNASLGIYIYLSKVKTVTLSISGPIANPGSYELPGSNRISDLIRAANNGKMPDLDGINFREIEVIGRDTSYQVDMYLFLFKNKLQSDPYVYPGDNIHFNKVTRKIFFNGIEAKGAFKSVPIKENESLFEFLSLFRYDERLDSNSILLQKNHQIEPITNKKKLNWSETKEFYLQDQDQVTILEKKYYQNVHSVSLSGEAASPGSYPIVRGKTTLNEIVQLAGGPTEFGDEAKIVVLREGKTDDGSIKNILNGNPGSKAGISIIRPELYAGLTKAQEMGDYTIIRKNKSEKELILANGDQIFIPKKDSFVYISGNVYNAGAYKYVPGNKYMDYIRIAGGYLKSADTRNAFIIRSYGKVSQINSTDEVVSGDLIIIPDLQEGKRLATYTLPITQLIVTGITAVISILAITVLRN